MADDDAEANDRTGHAAPASPFLSPEQAAHYLGVSTRTLQEHRSKGTGPRFRRHSRFVRYHITDIENWSKTIGEAGSHD